MKQNKSLGIIKKIGLVLCARKNRALLGLSALVLLLFALVVFILSTSETSPPATNKSTAPRRLLGLDLSEWQEPEKIDYDRLAAQLDFVILRAGYTGNEKGNVYREDKAFQKHYAEFHKRGLPIGVYWYACADTEAEGEAEAEALLAIIRDKTISLPVFWDTEDKHHQEKASPEMLTNVALAFGEKVRAAGYRPGLYSHAYWFRDQLRLSRLKDYEIWLASWDETPPIDQRYDILQYTEKGKLTGYEGALDLNESHWVYGPDSAK